MRQDGYIRFICRLVMAVMGVVMLGIGLPRPSFAQSSLERNAHAVAVVIGNSNYQRAPRVAYAHEDARRVKAFLIQVLGFRERNIIYREDATAGQMLDIFGDEKAPRGELWSLITPGKSDVFVFYSGHGVPVPIEGAPGMSQAHLLPVDVAASNAHRGLAIDTLERGLARLAPELGEDSTITIVLDACFSGSSQAGPLLESSMAIGTPRLTPAPDGLIRLAAAQGDQLAYWDGEAKAGIFTNVFLSGARGAADQSPNGNGDGVVSGTELARYLEDNVVQRARRLHRAVQRPAFSGAMERIGFAVPKHTGALVQPLGDAAMFRLRLPRTEYKVNELLTLEVETDRACELQIVYMKAGGQVTAFSEQITGKPLLADGELRRIPVAGSTRQLRFDAPGSDTMLAAYCRPLGSQGPPLSASQIADMAQRQARAAPRPTGQERNSITQGIEIRGPLALVRLTVKP